MPIGIDADADATAVELEPVRLGVDPEHAQARRAEVARVVADLEADVVRPEDAAQQLLARGQQAVDLRGRERDVQEEADRESRRSRAQHRGNEHEMEVVHPHARVGLAVLEDRLREALVHLDVARPRLRRDPQALREVVEERPQRVVAHLPVEVRLLLRGEEDRVEVVLGEPRPHALLPRRRHDHSRPPDPGRVAAHRRESGRQPAHAAVDLDLAALGGQTYGQPIARDDEPVMSAVACHPSSIVPFLGREPPRLARIA